MYLKKVGLLIDAIKSVNCDTYLLSSSHSLSSSNSHKVGN